MSQKYNTKQRYNSIQGLRSFKDTLPTEAKRIISKKGKIYNETLDNWKYLVGKDLFKVSFPKSYKSSNKLSGSRLNILVKRGNEVDVEYSKKEIIKKINVFFGYHVLDDIKLNTFDGKIEESHKNTAINATKNKHIKSINNIKNDKIKNSLLELSKHFKTINEENNKDCEIKSGNIFVGKIIPANIDFEKSVLGNKSKPIIKPNTYPRG